MINKEMKAADLASVTGGGWKTNLAIGGSAQLQDLLERWYALEPTMVHGLCAIKERTYEQ